MTTNILHPKLIHPSSIVVVGASENIHSPGGKVLKNLITNGFRGKLYGVNRKLTEVQGLACYQDLEELPEVDLAIIAIAAKFCVATVKQLTEEKNTKAFIIFSAGFSEHNAEGALMEKEIVRLVERVGGSLLGPNNIGLLNTHYAGVFTTPIPKIDPKGVDFISSSGATAVFTIEAAIAYGLSFNSVYSVGNSAQIGVEEVLEHLDFTYNIKTSPRIKILYIESIEKPQKLLKYAISLRRKGCKIVAIKAGSSNAGSRAASSHTGALATADTAVNALFQKAGIIRCYGRSELLHVVGVLTYPQLQAKNVAIITHAGGPAVMLTDVLSENGLQVPKITHPKTGQLLEQLFPGSSVENPIDFLATGTAEQLGTIIDYCDKDFDDINAMVVVFGSPGLFDVTDVYNILDEKIRTSKKPIFPVLPSVVNVADAITEFIEKGHFVFFDEVLFGKALAKVAAMPIPEEYKPITDTAKKKELNTLIKNCKEGYLPPKIIQRIFDCMGIPQVTEYVLKDMADWKKIEHLLAYPLVLKVVGPVHKTDVKGVRLDIRNKKDFIRNFEELLQIPDATAVLLQPMLKGTELYVGAKREGAFGHTIVCGLGGILIELLKDVSIGLAPLSISEVYKLLENLKTYPVLRGYRGKKGIDVAQFAEIIQKVATLVCLLPEIAELDINPLLANEKEIIAVDARVWIDRNCASSETEY